jgi:hypothetical protein
MATGRHGAASPDVAAAPIYVITASLPWTDVPYQVAYEWGALFKSLALQTAC